MTEEHTPGSPSRRKIGIATLSALAAGLFILVAFVMPAEFDIDPLQTGRLLGLTELAESGDNPILDQFVDHGSDYVEFVLEPFQSVEYKYLMDENTAMLYSWRTEGEVYYDMHAEPSGIPDAEESYAAGESNAERGVYVAPFTGIHGWFWENRSFEEVTVRLHSAGFYVSATVFRDGSTFDRDLPDVFESDDAAAGP